MTNHDTTMTPEHLRIDSSRGALEAVLHHPVGNAQGLVVLCPGYLDSKDYRHLVRLADDFARAGFAAARFDPTGTWASDGTIADYTTSQYLLDLRTVLDELLHERPYPQVIVGGHSKGGYVALLHAARDPRVTTVVGIMAPPSIESVYDTVKQHKLAAWKQDGYKVSQRDLPDGLGMREYRVPYAYVIDRRTHDLSTAMRNYQGRTILLTSTGDDLVSAASVRQIYDWANEPKEFILLEGIEHDYRHTESAISIVNRAILDHFK